jgi:hypothetical protein
MPFNIQTKPTRPSIAPDRNRPRRLKSHVWIPMRCAWLPPIVASALLVSGCVNTSVIRYETVIRPPKPRDCSMDIFEAANIRRPYKTIGVVQANAGRLHAPADTIRSLKREACLLGGDGLMDLQRGAAPSGVATPVGGGAYVHQGLREMWSAKVIVFEGSQSAAAAPK